MAKIFEEVWTTGKAPTHLMNVEVGDLYSNGMRRTCEAVLSHSCTKTWTAAQQVSLLNSVWRLSAPTSCDCVQGSKHTECPLPTTLSFGRKRERSPEPLIPFFIAVYRWRRRALWSSVTFDSLQGRLMEYNLQLRSRVCANGHWSSYSVAHAPPTPAIPESNEGDQVEIPPEYFFL